MSSSTPIDMCANCGKGEEHSNKLKTCTACLSVKYCSRDCQIVHRPQHKKACKKRAAELYDEKLFKEVEGEDCPICMLPMPLEGVSYKSCCSKRICEGCICAMALRAKGSMPLCPFCRKQSVPPGEEQIRLVEKHMKSGDVLAYKNLALYYANGEHGLSQDYQKANELWLKAGELGCAEAYFNLGQSYHEGKGVESDIKKAKYYWELAAMLGSLQARFNVGAFEGNSGNHHRAFRHYIIAARAGDKDSLDMVKQGYMNGIVKKDEYANTLRAYQHIHNEMKSVERDRARQVFASREKALKLGLLDEILAKARAGKGLENSKEFDEFILEEFGPNWLNKWGLNKG